MICFVFVCQAGNLEPKAVLLAASIRRYLAENACEVVAAIPEPEETWGRVSETTLTALASLGVKTQNVRNEISVEYPVGNKLGCLAIDTRCDTVVLLDTDMLLMRQPALAQLAEPVAAVPASYSHVPHDLWTRLYAEFDLEMPEADMRTAVSHEQTLPYVNTGFIAVHNVPGLASTWIDCAKRVRGVPDLPEDLRNWYLDQVSFPLAVRRHGANIHYLPRDWNFMHWTDFDVRSLPIFFHYRRPWGLFENRSVVALLREILESHALCKTAVVENKRFRYAFSKEPAVHDLLR